VLVAGADTLGEDPLGRLNLTAAALQAAVRHAARRCHDPASLRQAPPPAAARKLPLLLLGGGGYAAAPTARAWACATAAACGPFVEAHVLPTQVQAKPSN
jgi:acetoin utilization deacetylase AcuC-like enzyme